MKFSIYPLSFVVLTTVNIFFPTYAITGSLSASQMLLFGVLFVSLVAVLILGSKERKFAFCSELVIVSLVFFVFVFLQLAYFIAFPEHSLISAANVSRYIFYSMVLFYGFRVGIVADWYFVYRFTMVMLIAQIGFMTLQYIAPSSILVTPFSRHHLYDYFGKRVGGTFNWTYIEGYFLMMCVAFCIGVYRARGSSGGALFFLALASVGVLATQSRTAIASFAFIAVYVFLVTGRSVVKSVPTLMVLVLAMLPLMYFVSGWIDMTYITNTLSSGALSEGAEGLRLTHRLATFSNIGDMSGVELFVGGRKAMGITIENAYGHYTYRHGILGSFGYVFILLFLFVDTFRKLRRSLARVEMPILACGHGAIVALFLFSMSSSPIDSHKLGFILLTYIGLFYGYYYKGRATTLNG